MAQFRATIQGARGEVSRLGHKSTGMTVDVNGWQAGVRVVASYDPKTDTDVFEIYQTTGSSHRSGMKLIGTVKDDGEK